MAFSDFPKQQASIQLLQRSLERGRLGHGYLFVGSQIEQLEQITRTLAKTLNCLTPARKGGAAIDCCDRCLPCRKIEHGNHADVHWVRPESKSRIITIDQMRALMQEINLKPTEAEYKVGAIVCADRLNIQAANAFLKTLEEPPPRSVLTLLTTEPERILETIRSRCLRLIFAGDGKLAFDPDLVDWLGNFSQMAAAPQKSLLGRYRLMDVLLRKLNERKTAIEEALTAKSPLQQYKDAEKAQVDRWEDELAAAIEAEYRRQRGDLLALVEWWLRDVWLLTVQTETSGQLLSFPRLAATAALAKRLSSRDALENLQIVEQLQRRLHTNVQEALALEVSMLRLRL
jgi:DNA polymerase III subunit delta'